MANPISLPLYQKSPCKNTIARAVEVGILFLLLSLLAYRVFSVSDHGFPWLIAFLCESWFTFYWVIVVSIKWTPFDCKTYPERLFNRISELPPVDMFVTTADPILEPPILTVNTVLSLLAVDYPANKLACYVSDDGGSPLTFYSLVEASEFAKRWVPFCKKYDISVRAPFRYFNGYSTPSKTTSLEFQQEWRKMKDGYDQLCQNIENATHKSVPCDLSGEFAVFANIDSKNHPTIVKVIWENKEALPNGLPHLIYISREKRPKHPHHYKAGAMNVLSRVSGVMTNAPLMLNVDCDMFVNNPQIVLHALCLLLGINNERDIAFVQFPQSFYDGLKDDPYGNQLVVLYRFIGRGIAGIQGPMYGGTGCFHRRKVIYGLSPGEILSDGKLGFGDLQKKFGLSMEFTKSAAQVLSESKVETDSGSNILSSTEAANQVAGCGYEYGTSWGKEMGWIYGSTVEDVLTGLTIHSRGWRSAFCSPDPRGFLGCSPSSGPASLTQMKRWATGLLEILFSAKSPFKATFNGKLQFRQCLTYLWVLLWALRSVPEISYAILPAYCIITNSHFLPKFNEPSIVIPIAIFVIYNLYTMSEYLQTGESIRSWWNNQRMWRVTAMTAWLFGLFGVILKLLGISQTVFEVTQKDQTSDDDTNVNTGKFTFDESPVFVPGTTILLVNLVALVIGLLGFRPLTYGGDGAGLGEIICSVCVILCFWSFFKGLFRKGKYGIPLSTISKSMALAFLFLHFCKWTPMA